MNATITKLREENAKLRRENQRHKEREEELLEEIESHAEALVAAESETMRLKEAMKRQQVSLDCMYSDLEESRKTVERLRHQRAGQKLGAKSTVIGINIPSKREQEGLPSQAAHLTPIVEKSAQASKGGFFSGFGGAKNTLEQTIIKLEKENLKLRSDLVRLQSHYREEIYLTRKKQEIDILNENATTATVSPESSTTTINHDDSDEWSSGDDEHTEGSNHVLASKSGCGNKNPKTQNRVEQGNAVQNHEQMIYCVQEGPSSQESVPSLQATHHTHTGWSDEVQCSNDKTTTSTRNTHIVTVQPQVSTKISQPIVEHHLQTQSTKSMFGLLSQGNSRMGWW